MRNPRGLALVSAVCLLAAGAASGQQRLVENTVRLAEGAASPLATHSGMPWLAGCWTGEGLGGQVEEIFRHARVGGRSQRGTDQ